MRKSFVQQVGTARLLAVTLAVTTLAIAAQAQIGVVNSNTLGREWHRQYGEQAAGERWSKPRHEHQDRQHLLRRSRPRLRTSARQLPILDL